MPEGPECIAFEQNVLKSLQDHEKKHNAPLQASFVCFPASFAEGTATRPYRTASLDTSRYSTQLEPIPVDFTPRQCDLQKISCNFDGSTPGQYEPFLALLKPTKPGPLHIVTRGKQTFIACGYHGALLHWGLEAHLGELTRPHFDELLRNDTPGNNVDPEKANRLRTFQLSDKFQDPSSSQSSTRRTLTVMCAFVSDERVFAIIDQDRLVRFHVISLERFWTESDLKPGSELWPVIWSHFNSGPDWYLERDEAMNGLDRWRSLILERNDEKTTLLGALTGTGKKTDKGLSERFFSPFGRHTANDALHALMRFPGEPAISVCRDDGIFLDFKTGLERYMQQYRSPAYYRDCCNRSTTLNPLSFQANVDTKYTNRYMTVFRKASCWISVDDFNCFARLGLFDPYHHIGDTYTVPDNALLDPKTQASVRVPVWHRGDSLDAYTIIRAQPPRSGRFWVDGVESPAKDHRLAGYKSTVGPANFKSLKTNMTNADAAIKSMKAGRKPKPKNGTGVRGRPQKRANHRTAAELRQVVHKLEQIQPNADSARRNLEKWFGSRLEDNNTVQSDISSRTRSGKRRQEEDGCHSEAGEASSTQHSRRRKENMDPNVERPTKRLRVK